MTLQALVATDMQTRVVVLDGSGSGVIGVPVARWCGTQQTDPTYTNLGRSLTTGLIDSEDLQQLVNGDIVITGGTPGETCVMFFSRR